MTEGNVLDGTNQKLKVLAFLAFKNASFNPHMFMLYSEISKSGVEIIEYSRKEMTKRKYDILYLHWPKVFLDKKNLLSMLKSTRKSFKLFDRVRRRRVRIVWTIHNLKAHEQDYPFLENYFWNGFTKRLDGAISFSQIGLQLAREKWPQMDRIPSFVIPRAHYRGAYPNCIGRAEARARLNISESAFVFAHVGQIRPCKNVPGLVKEFREMARRDVVLLIAGAPKLPEYEREIRSAAMDSDRVRLFLNWIDDGDLQTYVNAADLMVYPYKDILNSGAAWLGVSFDRPVLVPCLGAMPELQEYVGRDWVRTYDGNLSAQILQDAMDWTLNQRRGQSAPLDDISWASVARKTIEAYSSIAGK